MKKTGCNPQNQGTPKDFTIFWDPDLDFEDFYFRRGNEEERQQETDFSTSD